ncbi:MAG: glycosyltransferase family 1 protein, partial [Treponema sp.]|nr:glycosyltransferase family 1 protein [Treponema sp.]
MKIAYFTDTFTPEINGVTNTLSRLQAWLDTKDIRYAFFAPDYAGRTCHEKGHHETGTGINNTPAGPVEEAVFQPAVRRFKGITTSLSPQSCLAFPRRREIFDLCDSFKPDLVHVVTELGIGNRGLQYARSRNLPLVMSCHTDYCKYLRYFHLDFFKPLTEKYLAWFYRSAHRILVPSKYTLEQLFKKQYRNLGLWSRGIDTEKFNPRFRSTSWRERLGINDKFVFLYVGRLSPEKGLDMLLYAIEELESRFPGKAAFVFTGGGPSADTIRQKNHSGVILTGFKTGSELSEIYASSDCFAFPSGTETFGNAPLEALASGLPVSAVASGGVTEFLSHGKNALLCAAEDPGAFTENLISIMNNGELRRELRENGRKLAQSRTWDLIFDDLLSVYTELIAGRRNSP